MLRIADLRLSYAAQLRASRYLVAGLGFVIAACSVQTAQAQFRWQGDDATSPQDWDTAANWENNTVPNGSGWTAIDITTGGNFPILAGDASVGDLYIGTGSNNKGRLDHTTGTLTSSGVTQQIGRDSGAEGTYTLSGDAAWSLGANTANIGLDSGIGTVSLTGSSSISSAAEINLGQNSGTGSVTVADSAGATIGGVFNVGLSGIGTVTLEDSATVNSGGVVIGSAAGANGEVTVSGGTYTSTQDVTVGSSGTGILTVEGSGVVNSAADKWLWIGRNGGSNGTLNLDGGTLTVAHIERQAGTSTINVDGGKIVANSSSWDLIDGGSVNVKSGGVTVETGTLIDKNFGAALDEDGGSAGGGLTKEGAGTLRLSNASTYTGDTNVNEGLLLAGNASALGTAGSLRLNGGVAFGTTTGLNIANDVVVTDTNTIGHGSQNGSGIELSGALTGDGTLQNFVGVGAGSSNVLFTGDLSGFSGTLEHTGAEGGDSQWWRVGSGNATATTIDLSNASLVLNMGAVASLSDFHKNFGFRDDSSNQLLKVGSLAGDGAFQAASGGGGNTLEVGYSNTDTTFSGVLGGGGFSDMSLVKAGSGTLTLSGGNSYVGGTTISAGTLQLGDGGTIGSLNTASAITNNGNFTINRSNAVAQGADFSGAAISGTGSFTQAGSGTTTLESNSYTGATIVNGGILQLNAGNGSSASVTVNNGGVLALNAGDALAFSDNINVPTINSGSTITNITADSRVTLWNGLTMTGGTLTSSGTGDGNGAYSISGTVVATSDASGNAATMSGAKIALQNRNIGNGSTTFNVSRGSMTPASDLTVSAELSSFGGTNTGVLKTGDGVLVLSGTNTYSGATTVNAGTLVGSNASAFGTGALDLNDGTVSTTVSNINLGGVSVDGGTLELNGSAAGTMTLSSGNNFAMTGGIWSLDLASFTDQIIGGGGSETFSITGGTFDLGGGAIDYGSTFQLLASFDTGSVSGLGFSNYNTSYIPTLSSSGSLSFSPIPEPGSALAGLLLGAGLMIRRRPRVA